MTEDNTYQLDESDTPSPKGPDRSPGVGDHALDLLNEMDEYISQIKANHGGQTTTRSSVDTPPSDPRVHPEEPIGNPPGFTPDTPDQFDQSQEWVKEHTLALGQREQELEERATAIEIERSELEDMKLRLTQEQEALAKEKKALIRERRSTSHGRLPRQSGSPTDPSAVHPDQAKIDQQKRKLRLQKKQLEQAYEKLKHKIAAFEKQKQRFEQTRQAHAQAPNARSSPVDAVPSAADEKQLRERLEQLQADEAVVNLARQQYVELLDQRQILVEVARYLPLAEQEMIRRWSIHRGVGLVGGMVSCLLFLVLFSYSLGQQVVRPVWRAQTLVGVSSSVFKKADYGSAWLTSVHQELVGDELLGEAIRLSAQRGVRIFNDASAMREALSHGMAIEMIAPGRISIEFRHPDKGLTVDVLKALGRAFVNHHTTQDRIAGQPNSMRIYEDAARDPQPIEDGRMMASAITFGVSTLVVFFLVLIFRWWLGRSVGGFDAEMIPELEQLETDDLWPTDSVLVPDDQDPPDEKSDQAEADDNACIPLAEDS